MSKRIDMTGKRFGRLLVTSFSHISKDGKAHWNVICDCGEKKTVASYHLRSGATKSCGCLSRELCLARGRGDLTGQRFGRLLVIERTDKRSQGNAVYLCRCDCGNFTEVRSGRLAGENYIRSCGCLQRDASREVCAARVGELHPNWNHDLTDEDRHATRLYPEYKEWRASVYKRDNYICQKCGDKKGGIRAHHIESYNSNKELRTTLENGVTLCADCHDTFHHIYGRGNNTSQQFAEFMENEGVKKTLMK